jgi:MoaA/NifB/PqqE/SkfB family radical SAM enzyme
VKKVNLRKLASKKWNRPLRALQIEVTSRCSRTCQICPRTHFGNKWREGDLTEETFQIIEKDFCQVDHVHLQGWGEPLLHPRISAWTKRAQKAGCTVGITTNGDFLEAAIPWLSEGDVTHLTVSMAGMTQMNKRMRGGADTEGLFRSVELLSDCLKKARKKLMIQISYLLTRENHKELSELVKISRSAGADEVYVIHLDCCPSSTLGDLAAYKRDSLLEGIEDSLLSARETARRVGITFRGPRTQGEDVLACALNPAYFVFVSWDGTVGPCVNLLLPVNGHIPRWSNMGSMKILPVVFGRIGPQTLQEILNSQIRRGFIQPFLMRFDAERRFLSSLDMEPGFGSIEKLDAAERERTKALQGFPFPESCKGCPKSRGW